MARVEVITGPKRRRRWSLEQKRAIVAESLAPGAVVTEIARREEICPGQIHRWGREIPAAWIGSLIASIRDAADRLPDTVLDDADAQRLQLAVELTRDQPLPRQLHRHGWIVREEFCEDRLRRRLRHRHHRR